MTEFAFVDPDGYVITFAEARGSAATGPRETS
jgi:hypothetical protein